MRLFALVLLPPLAMAQVQLHFGVEGGVPFTDTLSSSSSASISATTSSFDQYNSETKRLLIGPTFRVETQSGLGFEVDALYQRVDSDDATLSTQSGAGGYNDRSFQATVANRWQFPVLIQYSRHVARSEARWFVEAGPSISHIGDSRTEFTSTNISNGSTSSSKAGPSATWAGITGGGGITNYVAAAPSLPIKQNEASFLLGLTFKQNSPEVARNFQATSGVSYPPEEEWGQTTCLRAFMASE